MHVLISAALALVVTVSGSAVPSVPEIAARHISAMGGADRFRSLRSYRIAGHLTSSGRTATFLSERVRPDKMRREMTWNRESRISGYNGHDAWRSEGGGTRILTGREAAEIAESDFDDDPLLDFQQRGILVRLTGVVPLSGRSAYKLYTQTPKGVKRYIYVDTETYLDVRWDFIDPDGTQTQQVHSDYRPVSGILTPMTMVTSDIDGRDPMTSTTTQIELNIDIPSSRFDPPTR